MPASCTPISNQPFLGCCDYGGRVRPTQLAAKVSSVNVYFDANIDDPSTMMDLAYGILANRGFGSIDWQPSLLYDNLVYSVDRINGTTDETTISRVVDDADSMRNNLWHNYLTSSSYSIGGFQSRATASKILVDSNLDTTHCVQIGQWIGQTTNNLLDCYNELVPIEVLVPKPDIAIGNYTNAVSVFWPGSPSQLPECCSQAP